MPTLPPLNMKNYAFVLNIAKVNVSLPVEIIPGAFLDRATEAQVDEIRPVIEQFRPLGLPTTSWSTHETKKVPSGEGIWKPQSLSRDEWRYFVVNYDAMNLANRVDSAAALARAEIQIGFAHEEMNGFGRGIRMNPITMAQFYENVIWDDSLMLEVSSGDIEQISNLDTLLKNHDDSVLRISSRILELIKLRWVGRMSTLAFLGYFAVIESMLAHKPDPKDPYDSITKQVKNKMALLDRRFKSRLDYKSFFGDAKPDAIWTKLYGYRSAIAHGSSPDFKGELRVIKNHDHAIEFIRSATKALLRHGLEEPMLVNDLHQV